MSGRPKDPMDFWSSILTSRLSDLGLLSQPSDIRSEDVRRQALDDEIAAVSVLLSGLKERRNQSHPTLKLKFPQEVLEHIFAYAALNEVPGQGRKEALKPLGSLDVRGVESRIYEILGWVKVTHVCRLWRAIALANGNRWLWSTMDTGRLSAEGMCELLERSHPHPIAVNFTLSHPDEIDVIDVMFEPTYISRLKSLQMVADERTISKHLNGGQDMLAHATDNLTCLTDAAASLESLSVAVLYDDDEDGTYRPFTLPHLGFLHNLHCLTLKNAEFWLSRDAPVFPQLTHLDITIEPFYGGTSESFNSLVKFLRGSPHLQVLRLIGSIPRRGDLNEEDVGAMGVDLVCLRELHLKAFRIDECCALGEYLNFSRTCAITIDARIVRPVFGTSAFLKVGPLLQQWAESFLRLDVSFESPILSIQVSSKDKKAVVPDSPPRLHLILDLSQDRAQDPNSGTIRWVSNCKEKWMALFQGIKVLVLRCATVESAAAMQGLVSALHPSISDHVWRNHVWRRVRKGPCFPPFPFPDLRVLRIWCVKPSVLNIHDLRSCLEARRDQGLGNVLDIEFVFSDGMLPGADFEASLAELEGLTTCRIITDDA